MPRWHSTMRFLCRLTYPPHRVRIRPVLQIANYRTARWAGRGNGYGTESSWRLHHSRKYSTDTADFDELPSDLDFARALPLGHSPDDTKQEDIDSRDVRDSKRKSSEAQEDLNLEVRLLRSSLERLAGQVMGWAAVTRDNSKSTLKDSAYYTASADYPQHFEYPYLPNQFFDPSPNISFRALAAALPHTPSARTTETVLKRSNGYIWRIKMSVNYDGATFVAIGEAPDRDSAKNAAHVHLFLQMHRGNRLQRQFSRTTTNDTAVAPTDQAITFKNGQHVRIFPDESIKRDPDAKIHVYNFAAQSLSIPNINVERIASSYYVGTVGLSSSKVEVHAAAQSEEDAELAACIAFKNQMELDRMQASLEALSLRRDKALNLDNAGEFIQFYEYKTKQKVTFISKCVRSTVHGKCWSVTGNVGKSITTPTITMQTYDEARLVARLVAAVKIATHHRAMLRQYFVLSRQGMVPRHIAPLDLPIDSESNGLLSNVVSRSSRFLPDDSEESNKLSGLDRTLLQLQANRSPMYLRNRMHSTLISRESRSQELLRRQEAMKLDQRFRDNQAILSDYPISQRRVEILDMIMRNPFSMVIGATGSGKSTLVPQIILEDAIREGHGASCNIICTEPRRIAAISLAHRVANDRFEALGEVVGYHISGVTNVSRLGGSISFYTPEIVYLHLTQEQDEFMDGTSHVIIDEMHERDESTEKMLTALKLVIRRRLGQGRPTPKIIMMSATGQSELFSKYFSNEADPSDLRIPSITVPGRLHPIEDVYLDEIMQGLRDSYSPRRLKSMLGQSHTQRYVSSEIHPENMQVVQEETKDATPIIDWKSQYEIERDDTSPLLSQQLVAAKIAQLLRTTHNGSLLVFLPGWREILDVEELLRQPLFGSLNFSENSKYKIVLLHSERSDTQNALLESVSPGSRRIILATNIAESSLTFPDVKYVIDAGKHRNADWIKDLDLARLSIGWASKSSFIQRAGRAGRVQPGSYYGLYSKTRLGLAPETRPAQLMNADELQTIGVRAKLTFPDLPIRSFFSQYIEPLPTAIIDDALSELKAMNAIYDDEEPTSFGLLVAGIGIPPSAVKMAILGTLLRCLRPAILLVALRQQGSLFISALRRHEQEEANQIRRKYSVATSSDHIADVNAFMDLNAVYRADGEEAARSFAQRQFLHFDKFLTIDKVVGSLIAVMSRLRLLNHPSDVLNMRSANNVVLKALIVAGSGLAVHNSAYRYYTAKGVDGTLGENSLTRPPDWRLGTWKPNPLKGNIVAYENLISTSSFGGTAYLRTATPIPPIAAALFSRSLTASAKEGEDDLLYVDGWIPLRVGDQETKRVILELRKVWDRIVNAALQGKRFGSRDDRATELVSSVIVDLLGAAEKRLASVGIGNGDENGSGKSKRKGHGTVRGDGHRNGNGRDGNGFVHGPEQQSANM